MAILIDNNGLQHYANQMVKGENRKVNGQPLPSVLTDIDKTLDEMKVLFDEEYGSALDMKLENNENVFSVGTGSGVDKRSEVENSFSDVEVFGESLVNLKGEYKGVGDGLNTIVVGREVKLTTTEENKNPSIGIVNRGMFKDNTVYSIIIKVKKFTGNIRLRTVRSETFGANLQTVPQNHIGVLVQKFTTNKTNATQWGSDYNLYVMAGEGSITVEDLIILEGDYTNKPLPQYFEGLKSVGEKEDRNEIEVLSRGKNLVNVNLKDMKHPNGLYVSTVLFNIPSGVDCKLSARDYLLPNSGDGGIRVYDEDKNFIRKVSFKSALKLDANEKFIDIYAHVGSTDKVLELAETPIQVEIGAMETSFEAYKEDKKQILINEPLRGLPNGARDSIEKVNGEWKLIRRCSEVVLDGSESEWENKYNKDTPLTEGFYTKQSFITPSSNSGVDETKKAMCDRFFVGQHQWQFNEGFILDTEFISHTSDGRIAIRVLKTQLSDLTISSFKQWLSQNPTKVIYQLANPIIEDIDEATLQSWKNGTISLDEVLPVTTTHTVALNKPMQIKRNIEELTQLRNRVQALEETYDTLALEQAHQLDMLAHNFELDYNY